MAPCRRQGPINHSWFQSRGQGRRQAPRMPNKRSLSKGSGGAHISAYRAQNPAAVLPRRGFALALVEIRRSSLLPRGVPKMMLASGTKPAPMSFTWNSRSAARRNFWRLHPVDPQSRAHSRFPCCEGAISERAVSPSANLCRTRNENGTPWNDWLCFPIAHDIWY